MKLLPMLSTILLSINKMDGLSSFQFAVAVLIIVTLVWLIPILSIISSRKTTGREKLAWLLAVLFISWFAWIFYLLLAPIKKKH